MSCLRGSRNAPSTSVLLLGALLFFLSDRAVSADDWAGFLGPERNGLSTETDLIDSWTTAGPKELWRVPGGVGMSGIAVSDSLVVTLVQDEKHQSALALDLTTGKSVWRAELAPAYENQMGNGPRATPAITEDQVIVLTGEGILIALDRADGQLQWQQNIVEATEGSVADYGMASSPLVVGNLVIATAGSETGTLVACDLASGRLVWQAGTDRAGYSSPVVRRVGTGAGAMDQLIVFAAASVLGIDPADGSVLWSHPYETPYDCNIAAPIEIEGKLLISSGENHGSMLLAPQSLTAGGSWKVEIEWESQGPRSALRSEWQTPLLVDGWVYGFDNVGSAGPVTHLTCIDPATGEMKWRQERFGKGNAIAADGKLFATTMEGDLVLIKASGESYQELGRAALHAGTRQAPALSNGILLIRDDQEIIAFDVRK